MRSVQLWSAALVAVVLSACQTLPQVPYDRATAGNIKTINVVQPGMPDRPHVLLLSTVGQSFGLIGALIDAGMQDSRESDFEAMTKAKNFAGNDVFASRLDAALAAEGYTPVHSGGKHPTNGFLKAYAQPTGAPADAHLDIMMNYGYYATGLSTPYRPFVYLDSKLVRASDNVLLMQKTVVYNPLNEPPKEAVTIAPDGAYVFDDFDALKGDPDKAMKGLDVAIQQVAGAMGTLLK